MRVIILVAAVAVCSTQTWAQEISCPEGTFKGEDPVQNNVHVVYCQKWVQTGGGLVSKPKNELMRHGPYRIYEKVDPAFMKFQLLLTGQFEEGKPAGVWKQLYEGGETKAEFKVNGDIRADGPYTMFYPDGKTKAVGPYENGDPVKEWKFFSPEGKVLAQGKYDAVRKAMDQADAKEEARRSSEQQAKNKSAAANKEEVPFGAPCGEWIETQSADAYFQQIEAQAQAHGRSVEADFPGLERKTRATRGRFILAKERFEKSSKTRFKSDWCQ